MISRGIGICLDASRVWRRLSLSVRCRLATEGDAKNTIALQITWRRIFLSCATKLSVRRCKPQQRNQILKFGSYPLIWQFSLQLQIHSVFLGCTEYVSIPEFNQSGAPNVHHCRMKSHHWSLQLLIHKQHPQTVSASDHARTNQGHHHVRERSNRSVSSPIPQNFRRTH